MFCCVLLVNNPWVVPYFELCMVGGRRYSQCYNASSFAMLDDFGVIYKQDVDKIS